jgi:predicted nucleotidyltransferase
MRLSLDERAAIAATSQEAFPPGTRVLLFGSRLDDARRGGDIDLLVEPPRALSPDELVERRTRFVARLYRLLEERCIDVVVTPGRQHDDRSLVRAAREQGFELVAA